MSELKQYSNKIHDGFQSLLLMSTFLTNADLLKHIKEIQAKIRKDGK